MITKEQAENYFYQKLKHPVCPFCQSTEWQVATYKDQESQLVVAQVQDVKEEEKIGIPHLVSPENAPIFAGQAFISLRCANCNWIARFDYAAVLDEIHKESSK